MTERGKCSNPARVALLIGWISLWGVAILARLVQIQILQHEEYSRQALRSQQVTSELFAPRGIIYDARMDELAANVAVSTVAAEPMNIDDLEAAARGLASVLDLDFEELYARMSDPARRRFLIVKRRIDPKDESRVEALGISGVYLYEESMRVYPNCELASQTLGFVNMNGDGGAGIELLYDRELEGIQGQITFEVDARRRPFRGKVLVPSRQGNSLILSLDRSIQYIAERELAAGVESTRAAGGTAIVMESDSGRILALANYPGFNSNAYNEYPQELHRNRAVTDYFEPGSTFKVVVAAAALEQGLTRPDELIDCQMGALRIGRHVFHDHKPYGYLTFTQVLENSSNIGAAKLGLRLGDQRLHEALLHFGFGAKTGIDLPGEIPGLVRDLRNWSGLSAAAISFGQEVGVTSLQILCAINAIGNGGYRVRPFFVDRVVDEDGNLVRATVPERTRTMREETAAAVREAFEGVVLRGTARKAALEGYRAAGKTGTAQKIDGGRYSSTKFIASFIGFAPLPRPRISVLVQIDEPKGRIYGGDVSAPIFSRIAQEALMQLRIPPDQPLPVRPERIRSVTADDSGDFLPDATPVLPITSATETSEGLSQDGTVALLAAEESVSVPDFTTMSKRAVVERCQELGLRIQTQGEGAAIMQVPPSGTLVPVGSVCNVVFARSRPGRAGAPMAPARLQASAGKR
ncbi:MAG: ftsI [Acidobacteria bacterium]|nr:ftsI [Acidobacteriota bacterium]